ncbi:MAG TPA: excinuclease ABC subunit C [Planctomycetaceae bacterium]|nr:excinuclease ABC subunit C [Planctomycetaceae bacterium]
MLDAVESQRQSAIGYHLREFTVMAVAIHRGQFAKVSLRFGQSIALVLAFICSNSFAESETSGAALSDDAILAALRMASDGYSVDEIVIDDQHRERFLAAMNPAWQSLGDDWQRDTLLRLVSLRKAGKISLKATKRGRTAEPELAHVAEIAARSVLDQHPVSTDTLLCDPRLRDQLQFAATAIASPPGASQTPAVQPPDAYSIRKHLLRLRKTRHLRPELVQRVADWNRTIDTFTIDQLTAALQAGKISTGAGVYLFYDPTGYLYIGEAANLKTRLLQHTSQSDRVTLDQYLRSGSQGAITVELHTFGPQSPANDLSIRRAYESDLIRTRKPRFNIRP